ncbi:10195_t:CDS:2, partial [Funneliformis geosporum]
MSLPTNFDILRTIQEEHKEAYNKNKPLNKDESCVLYNPVKQKVNKTFKNFWNYHENAHNSEKTSKAAIALLYCINYTLYSSDLTTVLQHLLLITHHT